MAISAAIIGCSGLELSPDEISFYKDNNPWGFILFKRNIADREQVRRLCDALRNITGRDDTPILIDQEGGRVQRMGPPDWPAYPTGNAYGEVYARDQKLGIEMTRFGAHLIASDLREVGITVDCLPVLDVPVVGAHDVIGNRAYGNEPEIVATLGLAASNGLLDGGVLPVIKHIPGHGRAGVDSHLSLPIVECSREELEQDFAPFTKLADMPLAMTAHVIYSAIDADNPATTSKIVIDEIIRRYIGFSGLLMSDDLSMQALAGSLGQRAKAAFAAGCDVALHCNGQMDEMIAVMAEVPALDGQALKRAVSALEMIAAPRPSVDLADMRQRFNSVFSA
ncbi:beta-N-acetylhexosaminidase [Microvirga sp. W0021]|uniref:beta-N-acetylhexosaminidase n=1 Tax=Hohaiivirga grylli TaxID=3133970 RepID=A0ABV0BN03_9HYPH